MIIGVSGYARSGKDELGRFLCEDHGFERRGIGDVLNDILLGVDPLVMEKDGPKLPSGSPFGYKRVSGYEQVMGYDWLKDETDYRELQQRLGDSLRSSFGDDCLIDVMLSGAPARMVMTSTRHVNEADKIKAMGGVVWRINRPGVDRPNDHITETALDDYEFDTVITNDGTLDDLRDDVNFEIQCLIQQGRLTPWLSGTELH